MMKKKMYHHGLMSEKKLESELLQFQAILGKSFNLWNQCSEMLRSHVSFQNVLVLPCLADHHHTIASSTGEIVVGNIAIVLQGLLYQLLTQSVDFLNLYPLLFLKKYI